MAKIKVDESDFEFFYYLRKLFKQSNKNIDPLMAYSKYEIFLIKSTSKTAPVKIYGAVIKAV